MTRIIANVLGFCVLAGPVFAQGEAPVQVRGFGGLTFMSETAGIFGGGITVPVTAHVGVFGEIGRVTNALPRSLQEGLDAVARSMGTFFGGPLTIDGRAPSVYGAGGLRISRAAGPRLLLFIEGGGGVAHGVSRITAHAGATDVSRDVTAILRLKASETRPMLLVGAGVTVPIAGELALDLGYRYLRIFTEDPRINTAAMSAGVRWGF